MRYTGLDVTKQPDQGETAGRRFGRGAARLAALPVVHLYGARVHALTEAECVETVMDELDAGRGGWIVTLNLEHLRLHVHDPVYAACVKRASLVVPDGMPILWLSRLQGQPLPERVTGSNLIWSLSRAAAERGRSVFLLGGNPGTAERSAQILQGHAPRLRVAGVLCPPRGFEQEPAELARLKAALVAARPDIVYVALGARKQEQLISQLRLLLPGAWWLGVGISFSFVSGEIPRAPQVWQRLGLEWLHRLWREPRRLARRYLWLGLPFAAALLARTALSRLSGAKAGEAPQVKEIEQTGR